MLLTAACSSMKKLTVLMQHKTFGSYIHHYQTYRAITRKKKILAVFFLWGSLVLSMSLLQEVLFCLLLAIVGLGVTFYLLSLQTLKQQSQETT